MEMKVLTKVCTKCGIEKSLASFDRQKAGYLGFNSRCKKCKVLYAALNKEKIKARLKKYYVANKEKAKEKSKLYHANNRKKIAKRAKEYRANNAEKLKKKKKLYRKNNREKIALARKQYRKNNPEKLKKCDKIYRLTHKHERNLCRRKKGKIDSKYRLNRSMSSAISHALKKNKKGKHWEFFVDYTLEELRSHLEKQFTLGMTWGNYGEWHVDHKIPKSVFNYTKPEHGDFKKAWALSNLQPLWATDNLKKKNKLSKHFQPSLLI